MPVRTHPFADRLAVVTGGARGLGLAVARELAQRGANIALLDVQDEVARAARELASDTGRQALGLTCDITDEVSIAQALDAIEAHLGPVDHLVCAAGVASVQPALEVTAQDFRRVIDINLTGTFLACQAVARRLVAAGRPGTIVNFGSMSGYVANRPQDQVAYNASKAAVTMLTRSLAVEWLEWGIRVNSIAPGYMATDMTRQFVDQHPEMLRAWNSRTPMGRMGEPHEITGLVCFLLGDEASYITGQDYLVDGGYTLV